MYAEIFVQIACRYIDGFYTRREVFYRIAEELEEEGENLRVLVLEGDNKNERAESLIKQFGMKDYVFDTALPQPWVDHVSYLVNGASQRTDEEEWISIPYHFVWLYEGKSHIFGRPFPIDEIGIQVLSMISARVELR